MASAEAYMYFNKVSDYFESFKNYATQTSNKNAINIMTSIDNSTQHFSLTYIGLVIPYGDKDLGQHWLR